MPIYEYRCAEGHQYECWERFDAPTEQSCPSCGSHSQRILSLPAIIFKGSGFYSTDNRRSGGNGDSSGSASTASGESPASAPAPEPSPATSD